MPRDNSFIPQNTDYTKLLVYKRAECIYALTYAFCEKFLNPKDRTVDQMVQAARSGKQNIVEGMIDGNTSLEMKIKLLNVARGSMHELLADYEDFIISRRLSKWDKNDSRVSATRLFCRNHTDPSLFIKAVDVRPAETVANIAITMIHQYDYLMLNLIESVKADFLNHGGIKEEMSRARRKRLDGNK